MQHYSNLNLSYLIQRDITQVNKKLSIFSYKIG